MKLSARLVEVSALKRGVVVDTDYFTDTINIKLNDQNFCYRFCSGFIASFGYGLLLK